MYVILSHISNHRHKKHRAFWWCTFPRGRHFSCRRVAEPQEPSWITMGTRLICRPMPLESTIKRKPYLGRWGSYGSLGTWPCLSWNISGMTKCDRRSQVWIHIEKQLEKCPSWKSIRVYLVALGNVCWESGECPFDGERAFFEISE